MKMLQNVGVNTDHRKKHESAICIRTLSNKLKERNVQHTRINSIKNLSDIYAYGEMLGRGVFGTVIEITDKNTKKIWALKIVDKKTTKSTKINTIENEIRILRMVEHPHIVHLERTYESFKHIYMVLERCTTELATILKIRKHFAEPEVRQIMDYLSSAISYLHKHEIVHRDLKVENILTAPNPNDPSDEIYIKVSDFGLGIVKSCNKPDQMLSDRCGTLTYMAPEIISRSSYSQQCDVWAMGVICYLLLTGKFPFFSKHENELVDLICNHEPIYTGFTTSSKAVHFIMKMLEKNPALRTSANEVCRHPWIRGDTIGSESSNVLDMMQLWRSEMMVQPTNDHFSDWAQAFSSLEQNTGPSLPSNTKIIPNVTIKIPNETGTSQTYSKKCTKTESKDSINMIHTHRRKSLQSLCPSNIQTIMVDNETENTTNGNNLEHRNTIHSRALNVKGKSTKLIRIGKLK